MRGTPLCDQAVEPIPCGPQRDRSRGTGRVVNALMWVAAIVWLGVVGAGLYAFFDLRRHSRRAESARSGRIEPHFGGRTTIGCRRPHAALSFM
jgi:hypothetical protein